MIKNRKKFWIGSLGLITFVVAFFSGLSTTIGHKKAFDWADRLFNQLTKDSAYHIPVTIRKAASFKGVPMDLSVNPKWPGADEKTARMIRANGLEANVIGDGRVRIRGDLGEMSRSALMDADLLFKGREGELRARYGLDGKEVVYYWWAVYEDLVRRYVQLNRPEEAEFARLIMTRVLEPSYNFSGIEPQPISDNIPQVAFLLAVYILYTLWYGFAVLYLFEGIGITAQKALTKKEA